MGAEDFLGVIGGLVVGYLIGRRRRGSPSTSDFIDFDGDSVGRGFGNTEYKLVLCVRMDLKMQKGKIAAQCGHATLGVYKEAIRRSPREVQGWEESAQPKIVLQIRSMAEARTLERTARSKGIPTYMVYDAGRTQIAAVRAMAENSAINPLLFSDRSHVLENRADPVTTARSSPAPAILLGG